MAKLLIVESPNKARQITEHDYLPDWQVAASGGHIRDLPINGLGVDANYRPTYVVTEKGQKTVANLKNKVAAADDVYLATDPDREGEAISWHLMEVLKLKNPKRVTFDAITKETIQKAVQNPRQIDMNLVQAQETRRILDRLIGYPVTSSIRNTTGVFELAAGRVQSPAARLVVDREREIRSFKSVNHYSAKIEFDGGKWSARLDTKPLLGPDDEYLLDKAIAEQAAACRQFTVTNCTSGPARRAPPAPFDTTTMMAAASNALNISSDTVMKVAQSLFEQGLVTYHRTDGQNLPPEAIEAIRVVATDRKWELPTIGRKFKEKDGSQQGHPAIHPTDPSVERAGKTDQEQALYHLIWQRTIACQLADEKLLKTSLVLSAEQTGKKFRFTAGGAVQVSPGWKVLTVKAAEQEDDDDGDDSDEKNGDGSVPKFDIGTVKMADKGITVSSKTRPPPRYTEPSLIIKLEKIGIGRPSTMATTITKIQQHGLVRKVEKKFESTKTGELLVDTLCDKFSFIEYDYTRDLELELDKIAQGKADHDTVIRNIDGKLQEELKGLGGPKFPCPHCGKGLRRLESKETKGAYFWSCSGYPECPVMCSDDAGKPGAQRDGKPSEKQLEFARKLATENSKEIPTDALTDSKKLKEWIDEVLAAQPVKTASPAQLLLIGKLVAENKYPPPPGYPGNVSMKDAMKFLDKYVKIKRKVK